MKIIINHINVIRITFLFGAIDSCVARVCPENFNNYYQYFMPGIKQILMQAHGQDLLALKGKAIECAGLIGEAVGTEIFAADAREITSFFIHSLVIASLLYLSIEIDYIYQIIK